MNTSLLLSLLVVALSVQSLRSQTFDKNHLIGTWTLEKIEMESGLDLSGLKDLAYETIGGNPNTEKTKKIPEIVLNFGREGLLETIQMGQSYDATYQLNDSTLLLGEVDYKLTKLTSDTLNMKKEEFSTERFYYVRSGKDISEFKEE